MARQSRKFSLKFQLALLLIIACLAMYVRAQDDKEDSEKFDEISKDGDKSVDGDVEEAEDAIEEKNDEFTDGKHCLLFHFVPFIALFRFFINRLTFFVCFCYSCCDQ